MINNIFRALTLGLVLSLVVACGPTKQDVPVMPAPTPKPAAPKPQTPQPEVKQTISKIGFVAPLSGPHAEIGKALQRAAKMALFDMQNHDFEVIFADSQGTAAGAHRAVEEVVNKGAKLVVGPVFADEVQGVKALAAARNVPVLAFTTDKNMADGNVFVLGFPPQEQIERVLTYSASQGLTRIATLTPATPYGKLVLDAVKALEQKGTITIVARETYASQDIGTPSLAVKVEKIQEAHPQALLVPEGGATLSNLLPYLESYSLVQGDVQLLGSGQWDTPEVQTMNGLQGAIYASPMPLSRKDFESQYAQAFGEKAPRIATLAYDAVSLASILSARRDLNLKSLELPQGFGGVDGIFRFENHVAKRGLAILEVGGVVKDPAPQSFGK